ncbi:MAG: DUF362 domain-containing protein [Oscillospiraceae bacterium]|nr:DUF362 domain-containing protein [Oscillospiraceae bacterium]MBO7727272.1 DUF362 domain-containing protein [Oscillospiraceae bacterium]MBP5169393.1 DUF362 domain-containing protein [Oscillospiraceae bacterium]
MLTNKPVPGKNGNHYLPYEERTGNSSVVFFTRDLSEDGLKKIYDRVSSVLTGKVAVKLHTGEAEGPNILPRPWVKELIKSRLPEATIIETNTYYKGSRYTTEDHLKTLEINGWTFCPVDITDADGVATLPVADGKWFQEMHVGKNMLNYDSLLVLTHFKGHTQGGFGGSNKNIGIGCADGRIGKKEIHSHITMWDINKEELMERITESTKATMDHFAPHVCFINTMRNMSEDCDCMGPGAAPVVTPDIGILASLDILAVDNACVDLLYNLPDGGGKELIKRIESRHGLRQLSYMKELGMGNDRYTLIDIDHDDTEISAMEVVKDIRPGWKPDRYNTFWGRNKH